MSLYRLLFLCLFFCVIENVRAQNKESANKIDSLVYEITVNLSASNPTLALHLADSLYIYAPSPQEEIRALMLTTSVFQAQEQTSDALETVIKALEIAKTTNDFGMQARLYGYLATLSRQVGFFDEGRRYLEKGIAAISKSDSPSEIEAFKAMANREFADFEMEDNNFENAIRSLNLALEYYNKLPKSTQAEFMLSQIQEVKGRCYLGLNKSENALLAFRRAKKHTDNSNSNNTMYAALVYQGLGATFIKFDKMDSAQYYLKKAQIIAEPSTHNSIKEEVYESLSDLHKKLGNTDSASYYQQKHQDISRKNKHKRKHAVNKASQSLPKSASKVEEKSKTSFWWVLGGVFVALLAGFWSVVRRQTRSVSNSEKNTEEKEQIQITPDTESKIRERLLVFEKSKKYLDPNMTFSTLTSFANTNSKYLNHYLKSHYQKDYATYINDLRIAYIVQKIRHNKRFRNYKISHLAKESGFSSHSNFSANFKRVMELSPSEYIEEIKAEERLAKNS